MGLFSKRMPDDLDSMKIHSLIESLQSHYDWIRQTDDLTAFVTGTEFMKQDIEKLLNYEKKYPKFFKHKPSYGWNIIMKDCRTILKLL